LSIGLALITFLLLQRVNKDSSVSRAARITLGLLIALGVQALIGIIQARTGVPPLLVGLHMLGASVVASLLTFQWLAVRAK